MRNLITLLLLTLSTLWGGELHWESDIDTAFTKAKQNNLPLMVMVQTSNCRWCEKMKTQTLGDEGISQRLKSFVLLKVDRESLENEAIPYPKYVPTIYFMTPQKKILETVVGYFDILDFNSWIDDAQKASK